MRSCALRELLIAVHLLSGRPLTIPLDCTKFYSRSHAGVIRVYDAAGKVIEAHKHVRDLNNREHLCLLLPDLSELDSAFVELVAPGFQQWPNTTKRTARRVYRLGDL